MIDKEIKKQSLKIKLLSNGLDVKRQELTNIKDEIRRCIINFLAE